MPFRSQPFKNVFQNLPLNIVEEVIDVILLGKSNQTVTTTNLQIELLESPRDSEAATDTDL